MAKILLVEDDDIMRITLYDRLTGLGFTVDQEANGQAALQKLEANFYHLIISDIKLPGLTGVQLLEETRCLSPDTDVILMTAFGSVEDAVGCLRKGAADYVLKPFDMDDLTIRVQRLLVAQKAQIKCSSMEEKLQQTNILGHSPAIQQLHQKIAMVAPTDSTVLITGESGTGKELAAAAIHYQSKRAKEPYIKINCGAIPENLIESELFGHEKGAFTGAHSRKRGRFELADGGSLLLDEIGDLPLHLQVKLLRVLQEKEIELVGGSTPVSINVRIICATAKDLTEQVKKGDFREDLFYRLQVIPLSIPPLRERKQDIPVLCNHFLKEFSVMRGLQLTLSNGALDCLMHYNFPGNVRELRNIIERASVLTQSPVINLLELPGDLSGSMPLQGEVEPLNLAKAVGKAETACIMRALQKTNGNKTEAAVLLGISRKNLWEKLRTHNIEI